MTATGQPRALGVLLCYNDADIVADSLTALFDNKHDVIVWDHGSDDGTAEILDRFDCMLVERRFIARSFDFYKLHRLMSKNLIENYVQSYDWISWPDSDEILEGPDRSKSYYDFVADVFHSEFDWVLFRNLNFWFTEADDPGIAAATDRVKHYAIFPNCSPRIRAWRAASTNIRRFNHNAPLGNKYPVDFNLRHYPMRSRAQAERRLDKDRAGIRRGPENVHYESMSSDRGRILISPGNLNFDDAGELDIRPKFDWRTVYGPDDSPRE